MIWKAEPEIKFNKLTLLESMEAMSLAGLSLLSLEPDVTSSKPLKVESS